MLNLGRKEIKAGKNPLKVKSSPGPLRANTVRVQSLSVICFYGFYDPQNLGGRDLLELHRTTREIDRR